MDFFPPYLSYLPLILEVELDSDPVTQIVVLTGVRVRREELLPMHKYQSEGHIVQSYLLPVN